MFIALWWRGRQAGRRQAVWMDCSTVPVPVPPVAAPLRPSRRCPTNVRENCVRQCGAGKKRCGEEGRGGLYGALYARLKVALLPRIFNICPPLKRGINKTFPSGERERETERGREGGGASHASEMTRRATPTPLPPPPPPPAPKTSSTNGSRGPAGGQAALSFSPISPTATLP